MSQHQAPHHLLLVTIAACFVGCAEAPVDGPHDAARDALLFGLTEAEVTQIHEAYLPEEDLELTRARLTAPFDCALYDDFCGEVGAEAAEELTGEIVDLALDGATLAEIDAHLDTRIAEVRATRPAELEEATSFRGSGSWYDDYDASGDRRLRVHNGITTPVAGSRRAWTEAKTQRHNWAGWNTVQATEICVNAGTNTQTFYTYTSSTGTDATVIESFNPSNACDASVDSLESQTYHARNNGGEGDGIQWWYTIRANGCATAELDGFAFSVCAAQYSDTF